MANSVRLRTCCLLFICLPLLTSVTRSASVDSDAAKIESFDIDNHPTVLHLIEQINFLRNTVLELAERQNGGKGMRTTHFTQPANGIDDPAAAGIDPPDMDEVQYVKHTISMLEEKLNAVVENVTALRVIDDLEKRVTELKATSEANEAQLKAEIKSLRVEIDDMKTTKLRNEDPSSSVVLEKMVDEKLKSFNASVMRALDDNANGSSLLRLNTIERWNPARTCQELVDSDPTFRSGIYFIDPDGLRTGDPPILVHCEKSGETVVMHDTMEKTSVKQCAEPGCYSRNVNYSDATLRQMKALIQLSSHCSQRIRYDCNSAPLRFSGVEYAWWNDRSGNRQYYWTGNSADNAHTCSCGLSKSCIDRNLKCNCDASVGSALFDEGIITSKDHLPVTRLNFGRLLSSSSNGEHTLGPLRCSGARHVRNEKPTSCADLWQSGRLTHTGLYHVQDGSGLVLMLHCDMSKMPGDTGFETLIGVLYQHITQFFVMVENKAIVINLSAYKGRRMVVRTTRDHILAFQPVDSESLDAALKFIKIIDTEDGTHVTVDGKRLFDPYGFRGRAGKTAIYTKGNRAVIELSTDIPDWISIKISKAVECPFHLGDDTECCRVVDAESCYCAVFQKRTWQEQTTFCKTNGFSLLALESAQEKRAIAAWMNYQGLFWTSLNDQDKEGTWVWDATGATLTSSNYTNWHRGQPDDRDGSQDCVYFTDDGWYDDRCSENYPAICEKHPKYS